MPSPPGCAHGLGTSKERTVGPQAYVAAMAGAQDGLNARPEILALLRGLLHTSEVL